MILKNTFLSLILIMFHEPISLNLHIFTFYLEVLAAFDLIDEICCKQYLLAGFIG